MTPEQKEKFKSGMIAACVWDDSCPSDFGMKDVGKCKDDSGESKCKECAIQACEKFFKENNL